MDYRRKILKSARSEVPRRVEFHVSRKATPGWVQTHSELGMSLNEEKPDRLLQIPTAPPEVDRTTHINHELSLINRNRGFGDQQTLFHYSLGVPTHYEVHYLVGSRIGRIHSMNLIGMAKNVADQHGIPVRPSRDLSEHSLSLVKGMADRGIINTSDVPNVRSNGLDFEDDRFAREDRIKEIYPEEVSANEVAAGRETIRKLIKSTRKPRSGEAPAEQLQLDL